MTTSNKLKIILAMGGAWFLADVLLGAWRVGLAAYVASLTAEALLVKAAHCALVVVAVMWILMRQLRAPARDR